MNIVDSSLWLEFFADSDAGNEISEVLEDTENLIIPTIVL